MPTPAIYAQMARMLGLGDEPYSDRPDEPPVGGDAYFGDVGYVPSSFAPSAAQAEDERIRQLMEIVSGRSFTPLPVPDEPSRKERAFAGIADALSAYAKGKNPYVPTTDLLGELRQRRATREARQYENVRGQRTAQEESAREKAKQELEMRQEDRRNKRDVAREEARQADIAEREKARDDRLAARMESQAAAEAQTARELAELRGDIEIKVESVRRRFKDDTDRVLERQEAGERRTALKQLKQDVVDIKARVPELLKGGMTPDEIRSQFLDILDVENLSEEDRALLKQFFVDKVEPLFPKADENAMKDTRNVGERLFGWMAPEDKPKTPEPYKPLIGQRAR